MCCGSVRQSGAHLKNWSRGNGGTLQMEAKGIKICCFAALNLSSHNRLNSCSKWAVLAVILVSAENSRQEWWIHQRLIKDLSKNLYAALRCLHLSLVHLILVSRRKPAVQSLDKSKLLWFHVWHVLPVTVGIPLLPTTGGFPSPAFPPPSSVTRAREREKHNYRTEEIITQRLPHVTNHRKQPLHQPIVLMAAISYTGEHLTRSHQLLEPDQLFDLIKWRTKVKMHSCMCTYDRNPQLEPQRLPSEVCVTSAPPSASRWDTCTPPLYKAGGLL